MNNLQSMLRITGLVFLLSLGLGLTQSRSTFGADPVINAAWEEGGTPILGIHYIVTTTSPASVDFPDVELRFGSLTWQIW